jgi:hypothetical protein
MLTSPAGRNAARTLGGYGLLLTLALGLGKWSPSGPCVLGLGAWLLLLGLPIISFSLLIFNFWLVVGGEKQHRISLLLHGLALGGWLLLLRPF